MLPLQHPYATSNRIPDTVAPGDPANSVRCPIMALRGVTGNYFLVSNSERSPPGVKGCWLATG